MYTRQAAVIVVLFASFAAVEVGQADPVNLDRPSPVPVLGTILQDEFDAWRTTGPGVDVLADQERFAQFSNTASGGSVVVLGREFSSSGGGHRFGLYDAADPTKRAVVFDSTGGTGAGSNQRLVAFMSNGDVGVNGVVAGTGFQTPFDFGFFLEVFSGGDSPTLLRTYFSEDDRNPSNLAQALVFQGDNSTTLAIDPFSPGLFTAREFIVAFDDGPSQDEKDFADFVVLFESAVPVPEPAVGLLLALGAGVLGSLRRRRS